jgi:heptaprenyl diphosphate synthase
MIPKPLPFIRLGLANLPLLLALDILPLSSFALLCGVKIIGQALISGTLFSYVFLFSLGGTSVSAFLMYVLRRGVGKEKISLIGTSAAGALASNWTTLVLAYFFVFGESIRYVAVPILALGIITGTLLGILSEYFTMRSNWYNWYNRYTRPEDPVAAARQTLTPKDPAHQSFGSQRSALKSREDFCLKTFNSGELAIAGLCMMPALLFNPDTCARVIQFLFFYFLAWLSGKRNNPLLTVSVMLGIVFFNLLIPYGELLFSIGPLKITSGALLGGIRRAATLEGLFMLSRCCVRNDLALPGTFGEIIGESFRVFSGMTEEKVFFTRQNWLERLDGLLIKYEESFNTGITGGSETKKLRQPGRGSGSRIILCIVVILSWLPVILSR